MKRFIAVIAILLLTAVSQPVAAQSSEEIWNSLTSLAAIIAGGSDAEKLVGNLGASALEEEQGFSNDEQLNERVTRIAKRLLSTKSGQREGFKYQTRVLNSGEINAYALPGGQLFVTEGLLSLPGVTDDEIAFVLAHELTHTNKAHGFKKLRESLIGNALLSAIGDKKVRFIAALGEQLFTSGRSKSDEQEADRLGFATAKEAGFNPSGGLAFMRRLELLGKTDTDPLTRLFATHPPTTERSAWLKNAMFESQYGSAVMVGAVSTVKLGKIAEFGNDDSAWVQAYKDSTGFEVYKTEKPDNPFDRGQCTWFVRATRPDDELPGGARPRDGRVWLERCEARGYAVSHERSGGIPGAIAVWDKSVGGGSGHVATVTKIHANGYLEVWDANWSKPLDGKVRQRNIDPQKEKGLIGFVYWPNGAKLAPAGYPGHSVPSKGPVSITLLDHVVHLGDDQDSLTTIWSRLFELSASDVAGKTDAVVKLKVRAIPGKDPIVSFASVEVGRAKADQEGWQEFSYRFNPKLLHRGQNLVDIETVIPDHYDSYDDCEIKDVVLTLE